MEDLPTCYRDQDKTEIIATLVTYCFATLKRYGQRIEDLPIAIVVFNSVLKKYKTVDIEDAFDVYLSKEKELPTPSDIVNIICPPKEWCLQKFLAIKKKKESGDFLATKEKEYYQAYLDRDLKGW